MKKYLIIAVVASLAVCLQAQTQGFVHESSVEYTWPEEKEVLDKLDKWQDLKFGVLFHWGLYSVPGIVESWSICSEDVDWIPRDSTIDYNEYKKWYWGLMDKFNPTQFNPEQWANVCALAGMKYMIFTTKHHDGFNMFDTKQSDFSIAHGAFKDNPRADVAKYVFEAFREKNFMIGAYFSKPDWHSEYYWWPRYATATRNVNYKIENHPARWSMFQNFTYNQMFELMHNYGSIDIFWLDGGWVAAPKQDIKMDKIAAMAREAQRGLLIVDRTIHGKYENYQTPERSIPDGQKSYPWESCITFGNDWGWTPNAPFKSPDKIINMLVEVVAKGGNLLLGVGPTPEGLIQPEIVDRLQVIGAWLKTNGAAIYNTRITPVFQSGNVWFTANKDGKTLNAIYALPEGETLPEVIEWSGNVPAKNASMRLLQNGRKLKWSNNGDHVKVYLPSGSAIKNESIALSFKVQ